MEQQLDWEPMDVPRDGSPARGGREEGAVPAAMLVGRVVQLRELWCRVARLELPKLQRTMVPKKQV